jgi:hypothetical protein
MATCSFGTYYEVTHVCVAVEKGGGGQESSPSSGFFASAAPTQRLQERQRLFRTRRTQFTSTSPLLAHQVWRYFLHLELSKAILAGDPMLPAASGNGGSIQKLGKV